MPSNEKLHRAKKQKNDEFYTQYADIEKEMNAYIEYNPDVFRDKTILLPCDDPEWSNFTKYFAQNFERFGIKKLISTSYAADSKPKEIPYRPTLFEIESPKFDNKKTRSHGKIFILERDTNKDKKIDIDDLEWNYLKGDGDFRSKEVTKLRDEADFIITNPPFSLFREFLEWIKKSGKSFIIIGNLNAVTYKDVFTDLKENRIWLGATCFNGGAAYFIADPALYEPEKMSNQKHAYLKDGKFYWRVNGIRWYTNIDHGRRHQPLPLMTLDDNIKFSRHKTVRENGYIKYYNYDAIEVPYADAIPSDFTGVMGVPISIMDKYCPEQFEIIGYDGNEFAEELGIKAIGKDWVDLYRSQGGTGHMSPSMHSLVIIHNGKAITIYRRILIKHKEQP